MDDEEKAALESLYSSPGECDISGSEATINLSIKPNESIQDGTEEVLTIPVCVVLSIKKDYPDSIPEISIISEHLNRLQTSAIKAKVMQMAQEIIGYPMVLSILSMTEECLNEELAHVFDELQKKPISAVHSEVLSVDTIWTSVLHIDHMRSKNRYCKTLEKWTSELYLNGRLYFCHHLILVLLQGGMKNIKDFVVRLKTTSIDVDSKGHSCKERMMTPLYEEELPVQDLMLFNDFKRSELTNTKELEEEFVKAGLAQIYKSIHPNIRGYLSA